MRVLVEGLRTKYSIPMWVVVVILVLATISLGVFLGLLVVFVTGLISPSKKVPKVQQSNANQDISTTEFLETDSKKTK